MKDRFSLDPMANLRNYQEALRQMLESGWVLPRDLMPSAMNAIILPVDMLDFGPEFVIKASLPGVKPEDVALTVKDDELTIKATAAEDEDVRGAMYLRRERKVNLFYRTLKLPAPVEADRAEAVCKNGVLTLTLPKSKNTRPHIVKLETKK